MTRIFMCPPDFYDIQYEINPYMDLSVGVETGLPQKQWRDLYDIIKKAGAQICLLDPIDGVPDLIFTANAAMLHGKIAYLSHFRCPERQPEEQVYKQWFEQNGYEVVEFKNNFFEGAGDALFVGEKLFAGFGIRTDREAYDVIDSIPESNKIYCELSSHHFYHLDTCFCPLNNTQAIWYPNAFTEQSQKIMAENADLIPVPEQEAQHFACNAVVIDDHIIIPKNCPQTEKILQERGFTVHSCDMSEFLKAGGACKCLTLDVT